MTASPSSEPTQPPSPASPNYRFSFEPESQRVIAQFQGVTLADSRAAKLLTETRIAPVYHFPREDVRMDLFAGLIVSACAVVCVSICMSHKPFAGLIR
jgi:uncharacterized protein (DUF427 family)